MIVEQLAQVEEEDMALREAEAGAGLAGLIGSLLSNDSDSDSDDEDYTKTLAPIPSQQLHMMMR